MKRTNFILSIAWMMVLGMVACRQAKVDATSEQGDTIDFKYAKLLHVVRYDGYTIADIDNPWNEGTLLHRYIMVPRDSDMPQDLPEGTVVKVPLQRTVVFNTAHTKLFELLNAQDVVKGVCDLNYMVLPWVHEACQKGAVIDCGNGMEPMIEKIIDVEPDMLFLSPFENSGGYGKIDELNIPFFECADYMEPSALGRAEWMVLYGILLGREAQARALFEQVDSAYHDLMKKAAEMSLGKSIITERKTGNVWYVAAGKSVIGQLISDAHAKYAFADDDHYGSLSLPFETVLDKAGDTDVWLFKYDGDHPFTYANLLAEYPGYSQIKAVKDKQVYACNASKLPFFEETPFRPDWLLRDFIILSHPEINLGEPRYYSKLAE